MLAMNAGPRNGRTARSPRVRPWIASNAAIWTSGCGCHARSAVECERSIQTDRYHGREGGMQLGQPVIDCDIHASVPKVEALFPYLSDHWREYINTSAFKGTVDTAYPPNAPTTLRP